MGGSCTQGRDQAKGDGAVEINNMESKSCGWKGEEVGWGSEGKGKGGETENGLGCKEAVRWGRREQSPSCSL